MRTRPFFLPQPNRLNCKRVVSKFESNANTLSMSSNLQNDSAEEWISQAEAARLRGVSRQAVADLVRRKRVRIFRIGGRVLVNRSDIEGFVPGSAGRPPKRVLRKQP